MLLDKMCKCEMDLTSIVEDTERTRFCPQTDGQTDGRRKTSIPPFNFVKAGGIKTILHSIEPTNQLIQNRFAKHGPTYRDKWLIYGPKHHKDNQLKPETFLQIILVGM